MFIQLHFICALILVCFPTSQSSKGLDSSSCYRGDRNPRLLRSCRCSIAPMLRSISVINFITKRFVTFYALCHLYQCYCMSYGREMFIVDNRQQRSLKFVVGFSRVFVRLFVCLVFVWFYLFINLYFILLIFMFNFLGGGWRMKCADDVEVYFLSHSKWISPDNQT